MANEFLKNPYQVRPPALFPVSFGPGCAPGLPWSQNRTPCSSIGDCVCFFRPHGAPQPPIHPPTPAPQVLIGSADLKANHRITQQFEFVGEHEKYPKLLRILEKVRAGGCCRGGMWYCRGTSWVVLQGVLQGMAGLASGPGAQGTQA